MTETLKLPEVAQRLGVSEKTARRYVKAGDLPSMFVGNAYRVSEEDVERYLRQARVPAGGESPKKAQASPPPEDGERGSKKPETPFHDEEERRLRYLSVPRLHASKQSKLWATRVKRGDFGEEAFRKGVDDFLDFEAAFVQGVGTDLLAARREDGDALPKAEREALDAAEASIDAWHRMLWEASDILEAAAEVEDAEAQDTRNVINLDAHRERLKQRARGRFARGIEADDGANVS